MDLIVTAGRAFDAIARRLLKDDPKFQSERVAAKWIGRYDWKHYGRPAGWRSDWSKERVVAAVREAMGIGSLQVLARGIAENTLDNDGQENMLDTYMRAQNTPTSLYLGLLNSTPIKTTTLATMSNEPGGTYNYSRQALARNTTDWPTLATDSGDYMVTSKQVVFTAIGGSIGPVTYMFLCTAASGTSGYLVCYAALSTTRTMEDGETLGCTISIKLQ